MSHNTKEKIAAGAIFMLGLFSAVRAFLSADEQLFYGLIASAMFALSASMMSRQFAKHYLWSIGHISSRASSQKALVLFVVTILLQSYMLLLCFGFCGIFIFDIFETGIGQNVLLVGAAGFVGVLILSAVRESFNEARAAVGRIKRQADEDPEFDEDGEENWEDEDFDLENESGLIKDDPTIAAQTSDHSATDRDETPKSHHEKSLGDHNNGS